MILQTSVAEEADVHTLSAARERAVPAKARVMSVDRYILVFGDVYFFLGYLVFFFGRVLWCAGRELGKQLFNKHRTAGKKKRRRIGRTGD